MNDQEYKECLELIKERKKIATQSRALLAQFVRKTDGKLITKAFKDVKEYREVMTLLRENLGYYPERTVTYI